jgi:hypothetical protein
MIKNEFYVINTRPQKKTLNLTLRKFWDKNSQEEYGNFEEDIMEEASSLIGDFSLIVDLSDYAAPSAQNKEVLEKVFYDLKKQGLSKVALVEGENPTGKLALTSIVNDFKLPSKEFTYMNKAEQWLRQKPPKQMKSTSVQGKTSQKQKKSTPSSKSETRSLSKSQMKSRNSSQSGSQNQYSRNQSSSNN